MVSPPKLAGVDFPYQGDARGLAGVDYAYGEGSAGTPDVAGPYRQRGVMESLGEMGGGAKKFLTGDFSTGASQFAEGAGNLFAPGPSA